MPASGLAQFERESAAIQAEALALGRRGLQDIVAFSHREVITLSPVADPDQPGAGRLRASWNIGRNTAVEQFVGLPAAGTLAPPPESVTLAAAATVQLGEEIFIANGSPCVSTVNDRTSFIDQAIAATESKAQEICDELSRRDLGGVGALRRARP